MSLYDFIKDNADLDGVSGDICTEILSDRDFPAHASDIVQINYINRKALYHAHIKEAFKELITSYRQYQNQNMYSLRKSNYPICLPEGFKVDKVLMKGRSHDYYKVYLIDMSKDQALAIDMKLSYWRNKPKLVTASGLEANIPFDEYMSIEKANKALRGCAYSSALKPDRETFENVLSLLDQ